MSDTSARSRDSRLAILQSPEPRSLPETPPHHENHSQQSAPSESRPQERSHPQPSAPAESPPQERSHPQPSAPPESPPQQRNHPQPSAPPESPPQPGNNPQPSAPPQTPVRHGQQPPPKPPPQAQPKPYNTPPKRPLQLAELDSESSVQSGQVKNEGNNNFNITDIISNFKLEYLPLYTFKTFIFFVVLYIVYYSIRFMHDHAIDEDDVEIDDVEDDVAYTLQSRSRGRRRLRRPRRLFF
nr:pollen-specific leucine-rich repeat extensin-like protein 1 [Onthophagus taurus]